MVDQLLNHGFMSWKLEWFKLGQYGQNINLVFHFKGDYKSLKEAPSNSQYNTTTTVFECGFSKLSDEV